jgi:hypothetical protein
MTTTIKGNLILTKDTVFDESIVVEGSILGKDGDRYTLKVNGDINCLNIDCNNINAYYIVCRNIDCYNINCLDINCINIDCHNIDCHNINCNAINCYNIDCHDINASFILCESIKQKEGSKLIARHVLTKRSSYERKEQKAIE